MIKYLTAESVTEGHPDKLCDLIADSILDECLHKDKRSRVACEVLATKGKIIVAGEITCQGNLRIRPIVRSALDYVGYDPTDFQIDVYVHQQSGDISAGVNRSLEVREAVFASDDIGAGDQGIVYGYATNETPEMLPLPVVLAHRITGLLTLVRKCDVVFGLKPDGKAQVTVEYADGKPSRIKAIIVSTQHDENKSQSELREDILRFVLPEVFETFPFDDETEILINPSGRFVLGGPEADTGLTGRKLMVDTYGGLAAHGGGAFSGKDPTKVDRSGAYMARYVAKNIVAAGFTDRCEVSISYAMGKAEPVAVTVDTFGTGMVEDSILRQAVAQVFCFRPAAIIATLDLRRPMYSDTAVYGHFTNSGYPWEQINKTEELREAVDQLAHRKD